MSAHLVAVGVPPVADLPDLDAAAVAAALAEAGLPVASRAAIEDDEAALERALAAGGELTVVLTSAGGDDLVRHVLARALGARLVLNERFLAALEERYHRLDRPLPRRAERLALLPQGTQAWSAGDGEPGWLLEEGERAFAVLARDRGLRDLVAQHLVPYARQRAAARGPAAARTLRVAGIGAGELEERLAAWLVQPVDEVVVTLVPGEGEAWVRLRARGPDAGRALARAEAALLEALGDDCYGRDAETLEVVVGRMLVERRLMVAVAESCTGGLLGHRLTSVGGSSAYFERGVLVYSNRAKEELLGVPAEILRLHGAVSAPCAEAMARGMAERAGTACALSITGIAGPDGGTPTKPVGTVFVGVAVEGRVSARRFHFGGDRASVKWQSTQAALDLLRRALRVRA